jgi:amidase
MNAMGSAGFVRSFTDTAASLPSLDAARYQQAWQRRHAILRAWSMFLDDFPVVLMPTSCQPTFPVDHDTKGRAVMEKILTAYSPLSAVAGACMPAISVPAGLADGAPAGIQVLAAPFREERCLTVAAVLEQVIGPTLPVTPYPT